jgi:hypothetical protein
LFVVSSEVVLPLAIFFALGVPIFLLLWRVFVVGGELRRDAQRGRAAADIARRADVSLSELAAVVDDLRRRKAGPEMSGPSLRASAEALRRYGQEAASVDKQTHHSGNAGLEAEVERALRAVELIEHGRQLLLDPIGERVSEGETSVKRGYLNLLHAREAIKSRGEEIAAAAKAPAPADPRLRGKSR